MADRAVGEAFDFEDFVRRNYGRVLAYLLSRTRTSDLAHDLAQETFLQAYRSRHSYDPARAGQVEWVMGIARNVSANAARRQSSRAEQRVGLEAILERAWKAAPASAAEDERLYTLRRCLEELTERTRTILELLYEGGLSYAEIAEQLGLGLSAVKVAASRARQSLLECMRRRQGGRA